MHKIKIYLICWLISTLKMRKKQTRQATYHLKAFLKIMDIDIAVLKEK